MQKHLKPLDRNEKKTIKKTKKKKKKKKKKLGKKKNPRSILGPLVKIIDT